MNNLVRKVLEVGSFWCGVDALFYVLNRNRKRILTFHHVFPDKMAQGCRGCVAMLETDFRTLIGRIRHQWGFSLDIFDSKTVTLTFDDGYCSQVEVAASILEELGNIPAYLFVSGALLDGKDGPSQALIVDLLAVWVYYVPSGEYNLRVGDETFHLSLSDTESRRMAWSRHLWPLYLRDAKRLGRGVLEAVNGCYAVDRVIESLPEDYRHLRLRGVTRPQLQILATRGWAIGAHGFAHYPFGFLDDRAAYVDLEACMRALEMCLTSKVFSWPYGGKDTSGSEEWLMSFGFIAAVANENDPKVPKTRFMVPRMTVSSEFYAYHFEMSGAKHFFKYLKLLPKVSLPR